MSSLFIDYSPHEKALHRTAHADHSIVLIIESLQWVHPTNAFVKMSPVCLEQRLLEKVYKGVLHPLLDPVVHFALETRVYNLATETRCLPCLLMLQSFVLQGLIGR